MKDVKCYVLCMCMHAYILCMYTYLYVSGWVGEIGRGKGRISVLSGVIGVSPIEKLTVGRMSLSPRNSQH